MASFWKHVNNVLESADIIIEVLDARMVEESRNVEIERKIAASGKRILYVVTKCDLVSKEKVETESKKLRPSVFISSREKWGTTILKKKIMELSRGEKTVVGVVGYPNVGKSSLINALSGRGAARTSSESGFTKGVQKVRVGPKILLLDTPGVFPEQEKDKFKHSKLGAIDFGKIKDAETIALKLIEEFTEKITHYFSVEGDDEEEILEAIALKHNKVRAGGKPDFDKAARYLLKEWQKGNIR